MSRILVVDDSRTLRKVVTTTLERHGYEADAASDGLDALDKLRGPTGPYDLVLLDFVMPKMNGYQFCRVLRDDAELCGQPVVLMSAKSDKIRDTFVQQTGALDALSKPFDARALIVVVENALRRVERGAQSAARLELAEREPVSFAPPPPLNGEASLNDLPLLAGDLGTVAIGAVLQLIQMERLTGVLTVTRGDPPKPIDAPIEVTVTLRTGLVDLAQSRGQTTDEFRLGRHFIEAGLMTAEQLDAVVRGEVPEDGSDDTSTFTGVHPFKPPTEPVPTVKSPEVASDSMPSLPSIQSIQSVRDGQAPLLGGALVRSGRISSEQLKVALTRQSSELLYEVLRWPTGRFDFRRSLPSASAQRAKLGLSVPSLVMEGFRRVDEWRLLERKLGGFDDVLVRDQVALAAMDAAAIESPERAVLEAIDGMRSIREVVAASHLSSFDACRVLVQLIEARLVRRTP